MINNRTKAIGKSTYIFDIQLYHQTQAIEMKESKYTDTLLKPERLNQIDELDISFLRAIVIPCFYNNYWRLYVIDLSEEKACLFDTMSS